MKLRKIFSLEALRTQRVLLPQQLTATSPWLPQ